ncbi:MAG TPA: HDIG domain-containing protein [Thermoanaerobaculia bacterium]|jgi:putative nucleotidyltransferase with HDIG domain
MGTGRWPTRQEAEAILFEFTQSEALRKHGRAVEEAMRAYARKFGVEAPEEVERWGIVGLLHDFDYEQNTTDDTHLHVGGRVLRERGYADEMVEAIQSHADYMNIPRDTPMKKAIYACDELVGFIGACAKVRPSKKIADLPATSVIKRLKDKAFARSVDRSYVYGGAEALGVPLEEHIGFVIDALKPIAEEIGL